MNLRDPTKSTAFNNNFVELAMREPRRCDLHKSPALLALNAAMRHAAAVAAGAAAGASEERDVEEDKKQEKGKDDGEPFLQGNVAGARSGAAASRHDGTPALSHNCPDVMDVLREVCQPSGGALAAGNWGRWNFGGPGECRVEWATWWLDIGGALVVVGLGKPVSGVVEVVGYWWCSGSGWSLMRTTGGSGPACGVACGIGVQRVRQVCVKRRDTARQPGKQTDAGSAHFSINDAAAASPAAAAGGALVVFGDQVQEAHRTRWCAVTWA